MLSEASHYQVKALVHALHDYMAANMETLLEGRMLDDLTPSLIMQLTEFVRKQQGEKFVVTRSTQMYDRAIANHGEWLALQDIPQPIILTIRPGPPKESPRHSPSRPSRKNRRPSNPGSPTNSPVIRPLLQPPLPLQSGPSDEVFLMDDTNVSSASTGEGVAGQGLFGSLDPDVSLKPVPVWTRKSWTPKYTTVIVAINSSLTISSGWI